MKIALDATYSLGPELSGVGVYCSRLIESLAAAAPDVEFILYYRANRFLRALIKPPAAPHASRRLLEEGFPFFGERGVELFHGLNQRLPRRNFPRAVATFHDLFVLTGEYSTPEFRKRFAMLAREAAARADRIIAVSQYTAGQVGQLLAFDPSCVDVVHHGVDPLPQFSSDDLRTFRARYGLERPFVLHVGAIQLRKNISRLIEAFEGVSGCDLVLAGSSGFGAAAIHERIRRSSAAGRIHTLGYVGRGVIERLYRAASVLAFPSLEEGFGLPVLEAMSAGLPVVTSNGSALVEVAGDAALLVDPLDVTGIRSALERALEDGALRQGLKEKGTKRAAGFTWQRAAEKTLEVYRKVLS